MSKGEWVKTLGDIEVYKRHYSDADGYVEVSEDDV